MEDSLKTLILALLVFLSVYPFVVYPVILKLWDRRKTSAGVDDGRAGEMPAVSLIICALNEQGIIRQKMENCLELEYPREKLTILVVSDGSTDRTADIVREYERAGVVLLEHKSRRGKIANLNEVVQSRHEAIVVFSDANVLYEPDSICYLVRRFNDPTVGCVSGKVVLIDTTEDLSGSTDDYYSLEWRLQEQSSKLYSMVGADGAMYALRRELFQPCPTDTLVEDLVVPMRVIAQGKRTVFEPRAVGWEKGVESLREEFHRKIRIAAGVVQGLLRGNVWPSNAPLTYWFIFVSHKLLRWMSPLIQLLAVAAAASWINEVAAARVIIAGVLLISILALVKSLTGWKNAVLDAPFYFLFGQIAVAVGILKGLTGRQSVMWVKANR
jgi:biofilm PGA synthesis N-glycosyltransferase PgaC